MPSAAKRRKAALKKRMQVVTDDGAGGFQEGVDDLKIQEERDTDSSGETGSTASHDHHYPFIEGALESEKGYLVEGADDDGCAVEVEIKDERVGKDCGETGVGADESCRSPVKEGIKVVDETELFSVQCEGDVDGGVEKVYPGPEDSDSQHPSSQDNQGLDDLSFPLRDKTVEVANDVALDAQQSVLLPGGSVKIVSATEKEVDSEETVIDSEVLGLAVESDNLEEVVNKDLIMGTSQPNELADPVNWLHEATSVEVAPLISPADPASLLQNDDVSCASPSKEPNDSISSLEEPEERILSAIHAVSGIDIPNLTLNDAGDKLLTVDVDTTRSPEENGETKLENGPNKQNLAANGNEPFSKINGHYKEKSSDVEDAHNDNDDQHELPKVSRAVQKTAWMGCCGLFDVITGAR